MKPPRFKVQAYLVDGNLCREESKAVAQVVVAEMKPCEVMHLRGNLCNLREEEMHVLEELLPEEETFCINSLVMTSTTQETAKVQEMISMRREEVVEEFEKDVLSGKLSKDPPVRGPHGLAKIVVVPGAKAKRVRSYKLIGEREEALKKIIEEFVERGWLEPSCSEWGSPCFVVPKKEAGQWRLVVDYRVLNEVTVPDAYELPLINDMLQILSKRRLFTALDMKKCYHQRIHREV